MTTRDMTTRDELIASILAKSSPAPVAVSVDGMAVYVRIMTAFDSSEVRAKLAKYDNADHCETGRLLASLLCDESGLPLFDIDDREAMQKLAKLPPHMQAEILKAGNAANSFTGDAEKNP